MTVDLVERQIHVVNVAGSPLATFCQFLLVTRVSEEPYMYTHFSGEIFFKTIHMQDEQIYFKFCSRECNNSNNKSQTIFRQGENQNYTK